MNQSSERMNETEQDLFTSILGAAHRGEARVELSKPGNRGQTVARSYPKGSLPGELDSLRTEYGMTYKEIAAEMSRNLGSSISMTTIHSWVNGGNPRRKASPEEVERAIEAIKETRTPYEGGAWVQANEVQAEIQEWMKSLNARQIAIATDEALSTVRAWGRGERSVPREKWDRVTQRIRHALELQS